MSVDKVIHLRYINSKKSGLSPRRYDVQMKGGWTVVKVKRGDSVAVGVARCRATDTFCKKTGVQFARNRAESALSDLPENPGTFEQSVAISSPVPVEKLPMTVYNTVYSMIQR
jgi:hypothetical protein